MSNLAWSALFFRLRRGFCPALQEEETTHEHKDGVENDRADQIFQRQIPFSPGEDLSHDVDHSYDPDQPKDDAENAQRFFHAGPPLCSQGFHQHPQREDGRGPMKQVSGRRFYVT